MIWMMRTTAIPAVAATILIAFSLAAGPEHAAPATSPTDTVKPTPVFKVEEIASGLRAPWAIAFLPDGRVFFTERVGRVRVIENGRLRTEPVLTVSDIKSWTKMGLLGLAISPNFAADHLVFLAENYGDESHNFLRVVRYHEESGKLIEPTKLIDDIPAYLNHTGGRLRFGPDGKLYITTGDADKPPQAQDLRALNGKIVNIKPLGRRRLLGRCGRCRTFSLRGLGRVGSFSLMQRLGGRGLRQGKGRRSAAGHERTDRYA